LVTFQLFHYPAQISAPGVVRFASIALKSWISVQAAILLTATTPFPQLLVSMRAIGLPRLLVAIIGLMWRYLFILVDEALRLMRARESRSGGTISPHQKTGGSLAWRTKVTGGMVGSLFLRAFDRSDRIYMAMLARGYDGEVRSLTQPGITGGQKAILFAGLFIFVLLILSGLILSR
jgi:cobalt/nickel transport system permease protein